MNNSHTELEIVKSKIYTIRGVKVMLDRDLAKLYHVTTGNLNKAVKRNIERFPEDFMFRLSKSEWDSLRFQIGSLKQGAHSKYLPYTFTEMGISMLSSVLKSKMAIEINIRIMRAFVELRKTIAEHPEYTILRETIKHIESRMDTIEANHLVDNTIIGTKITQLSKDTQEVRRELLKFSKTLDEFQSAHIIIKKPEDGLYGEE